MIKVRVGGVEAQLPFDRATVEELKRIGARFDPATKTWVVEHVASHSPKLAALIPQLKELPVGRYFGNYFYFVGEEPAFLSYKVKKYAPLSCHEYCERRCVGADDKGLCVERCADRCEGEGWRPVGEVEETVKLYWRGKREGEWSVPRGLVYLIEEKLGIRPPHYDPDVTNAQIPREGLRDYQVQVLQSLLTALSKYGGGVAQMATGAGKSYMSGALARALQDAGYAVLVTALRIDLIYQLREFAKKFGASVVAHTVQTLHSRLVGGEVEFDDEEVGEIAKAYGGEEDVMKDEVVAELAEALRGKKGLLVVVDETHHVPARTVKEVVRKMAEVAEEHAGRGTKVHRVGLSATPWRNDGRDMEIYAWVGPVVEPRISSSFLIKHGYAVPVEIHVVRPPKCRAEGTFAQVRKALAECDERNRYIADLAKISPKPVLIITPLVKHAEELGDIIKNKNNIQNVEVVTGAVKGEERWRIYQRLRDGKVDVLVATTIADEGLDLKELKSLILAIGSKSKTLALQRVGRVVRPAPGKEYAVVYDLCDDAPFFSKHCKERIELYKTEPDWFVSLWR